MITAESVNFGWMVDGVLAGSARPGDGDPIEAHLEFFLAQGIRAIVSMTETPIDAEAVRGAGFEYLHLPLRDGTGPSVEEAARFVGFVDSIGAPVLVHCLAGLGRTSTMGAAYLIARGETADDAMRRMSTARIGGEYEGTLIMSSHQDECLREFERAVRARR